MNLLESALRRPWTVFVAAAAMVLLAAMALNRMPMDVFPSLDMPVIYVAQSFGGMAPTDMEGYVVNYYETNFLYLTGLDHIESRSIQNMAVIKLVFKPGTNMPQAVAETISYVGRAQAYMPKGIVAPYVMRFDAESVPVGDLVFSSPHRTAPDLDDLAQVRVRPVLAGLAGLAVPAPFGGNPRSVVVNLNPQALRAYGLSPDAVLTAVVSGNVVLPSGNLRLGDENRMVRLNSVVPDYHELLNIPLRTGSGPAVFLRDVATVDLGADVVSGFAELNGKRVVYIPVTKRGGASTLTVVNEVKDALPQIRAQLPSDVQVHFRFDQSVIVRDATHSLFIEGLLGALLTAGVIWLFLRDRRSSLIVVIIIPFSLLSALAALWLTGQTLNIMTLGGLALAIGILVDEATVAIENIHTHLAAGKPLRRAVLEACKEVRTPLLLAMLSVNAVFLSSFFMEGVSRSLFVPLSLAVGFAMVASYMLSLTLLPILAVKMLPEHEERHHEDPSSLMTRLRHGLEGAIESALPRRRGILIAYFAGSLLAVVFLLRVVGTDLFPRVDSGQFQMHIHAPAGTDVVRTEQIYRQVETILREEAGRGNVANTLGYAGAQPRSYPVNLIYLWTSGSHDGIMQVELRRGAGVRVAALEKRLRKRIRQQLPGVDVSFEPSDLISQVMNLGSPTAISVNVSGLDREADHAYARILKQRLAALPELADVQYGQPRDYPAVLVDLNRRRAGQLGVSLDTVGRSLTEVTASSRFIARNFWQNPATGVTYQVQLTVPPAQMASIDALSGVTLATTVARTASPGNQDIAGRSLDPTHRPLLLQDVVTPHLGTVPAEVDHYNLHRMVSLTANLNGDVDLGRAGAAVARVLRDAPPPPHGVEVQSVGQILPLQQTMSKLQIGLLLSVAAILLLLTAAFQSWRMALLILAMVPAVLCGVLLMLLLTGTTLNMESYMGTIMAVGISVANGILLVAVAEDRRRELGCDPQAGAGPAFLKTITARAAIIGTGMRVRPILMTTSAMVVGMIPLALALERGSEQSAAMGRAVIGGLIASTCATLFLLPLIFTAIQENVSVASPSLHPADMGHETDPVKPRLWEHEEDESGNAN